MDQRGRRRRRSVTGRLQEIFLLLHCEGRHGRCRTGRCCRHRRSSSTARECTGGVIANGGGVALSVLLSFIRVRPSSCRLPVRHADCDVRSRCDAGRAREVGVRVGHDDDQRRSGWGGVTCAPLSALCTAAASLSAGSGLDPLTRMDTDGDCTHESAVQRDGRGMGQRMSHGAATTVPLRFFFV